MSSKIDLEAVKRRFASAAPASAAPVNLTVIQALADSASDVPLLVARVEELEEESEGRFMSMVDLKKKLAGAIEALEFITAYGDFNEKVHRARIALDKLGYRVGTLAPWPRVTDAEVGGPQVSGSNDPKAPTPADDSAKIVRRVIETYVKGFMEILSSIKERLPR